MPGPAQPERAVATGDARGAPASVSDTLRVVTLRPLAVPVYFDFASTLSYAAHRVLGRLAPRLADMGMRCVWRPIDLSRLTGWQRGAPLDASRRRFAAAVAESLAGPIRVPPVWLDSRRASEILLALEPDEDTAAAWRERVWSGIFEQAQDPGDEHVVACWARDLGIEAIAQQAPRGALDPATDAARAVGVVAVPTLLLGTWPMAGIQEDRTMLALLTRFAARAPG